jgi:hypothetical protein
MGVDLIVKERFGQKQDVILNTVLAINTKMDLLDKKLNDNLDAIHNHLLNFMATEGDLFPTQFILIPIKNSFSFQEKLYTNYKIYFTCQKKGQMNILMGENQGYKLKQFTNLGYSLIFLSKCLLLIALKQLSGISVDIGLPVDTILGGIASQIKPVPNPPKKSKMVNQLSNLNDLMSDWDPKTLENVSFKDVEEFKKVNRDALRWIKEQLKGDTSKTGLVLCGNDWLCNDHQLDK